MAARNSPSWALVALLYRYRVVSSGGSWRSNQTHHRDLPSYKVGFGGSDDPGLRFISFTSRASCQSNLGMGKEQSEDVQAQPAILPTPPKFGFSNWVKWLLGSIVSFLLPLWKNKWENMLKLEGMVAKVVEEVEVAAEAVEKVATTADEALSEVADKLPDHSKLKEAVQAMEHVTNVAAKDAQLIDNIIHKVGDVKQDLEDLDAQAFGIFTSFGFLRFGELLEAGKLESAELKETSKLRAKPIPRV